MQILAEKNEPVKLKVTISRRYSIIITWINRGPNSIAAIRNTVIDVEENMVTEIIRSLPLYDIAKIEVVENE